MSLHSHHPRLRWSDIPQQPLHGQQLPPVSGAPVSHSLPVLPFYRAVSLRNSSHPSVFAMSLRKGSKYTNWQGGIRVNAFVSGGLLNAVAPGRIGTKLDGFTHVCDYYVTWCALAGIDAEDERAELAKLPRVDGMNLWPYLSGQVEFSPRKEVWADPSVLLMEINGTKWKLFGTLRGLDGRDLGHVLGENYHEVIETKQIHGARVDNTGAGYNCSSVHTSLTLQSPIAKIFVCKSEATCNQECCDACIANTSCAAWTVNDDAPKYQGATICILRDRIGPSEHKSTCSTGFVRGGPAPPSPPSPPGMPGRVSLSAACWAGPEYPNASNPACKSVQHCLHGCLYNLDTDPNEYQEVSSLHPDVIKVLAARLAQLQPTIFSPIRKGRDPEQQSLAARTAKARGGYWGPFIFP